MIRKTWTKPQITIITKHKPEENVLSTCKVSGSSTGSANGNSACYLDHSCVDICNALVAS
jgi:hypothetical protein